VITWNRELCELPLKQGYYYNYKAPLADPIAKIRGMFGYRKFIHDCLRQINPDVIIASHWSNLVLVADYKKDNQVLVYENLDVPTGNKFIRCISRIWEFRALKKVDLIIFASRFFKELYPKNHRCIVLENKPAFTAKCKRDLPQCPLKISFIGSVRYKEILSNLVQAVKDDSRVELYFYGDGEDLPYMKTLCEGSKNIFFSGRYDYDMVEQLYHQSHVVWAAYPNKDYNVVYAISNKFHESLYLGVPCIYSNNTRLADYVQEHNIGLIVDPYNVSAIKCMIDEICEGEINLNKIVMSINEYKNNETSWDEDFRSLINYFDSYAR
jgi:glycosyltransferase involved in cell wall biosynthesis